MIVMFTAMLLPFLAIFAHLEVMSAFPSSVLFVALGVMGCLIGGPINIITTAVAVDLAEHSSIGGRSDLMTVTGFINGSGSIIASLGLLVVGPVISQYGWGYVWYILIGCTIAGTVLLMPVVIKEFSRQRNVPENQIAHSNNHALVEVLIHHETSRYNGNDDYEITELRSKSSLVYQSIHNYHLEQSSP